MKRKYLAAVVFFAGICCLGFAGRLRFNRLNLEQGLSQATVNAMLQDQYGFMWFGTQDGLNRWDGYEFKIFRNNPDDDLSLSDGFIRSLFLDKLGRLWVGNNQGIDILDKDGFHLIPLTGPDPERKYRCNDILRDHAGNIWVGSDDGLFMFDEAHPEHSNILYFDSEEEDLSVRRLFLSRSGDLWIFTDKGLARFDQDAREVHFVDWSRGIPIWDGVESENMLILATGAGLHVYNPEDQSHQKVDSNIERPITCILLDDSGSLWVGTSGAGLFEMNDAEQILMGEGGWQEHYGHVPQNPYSLTDNSLRKIFQDRFGMIWLATNASGLSSFDPKGPPFHLINKIEDSEQTLPGNIILSVFKDSTDILWVSTLNGGVSKAPYGQENHFNENLQFENISLENKMSDATVDNIRAITEDSNGNIWLSSWGGGLFLLDSDNRQNPHPAGFRQFVAEPSRAGALQQNWLRFVFEDRQQRLWIGTDREGLCLIESGSDLKDENPKFLSFKASSGRSPDTPAGNRPRDMVADPTNPDRYWIGFFGNGLSRMELGEKVVFKHYGHHSKRVDARDRVRCLLALDQTLWIGTDGGLSRLPLDSDTENFITYQTRDGLPNNVIYGIKADSSGYLWLSTNRGLSRFHIQSGIFTNYTEFDGLQGLEFNHGASFRDPGGMIYFGGVNGLNVFDPQTIGQNTAPPSTMLTDIRVFNRAVQAIQKDGAMKLVPLLSREEGGTDFVPRLPDGPSETPALELDYHHKMLSFRFSGLQFFSPEENRYRYRLDGFDDDWLQTTAHQRNATYTNINPGTYTFIVQSANRDGVWDQSLETVQIRIRPPHWRTWWAFLIYGLGLCSIVFFYIHHQRAMRKRLENIVARRTEDLNKTNLELEAGNREMQIAQRQLVFQHKMASIAVLTRGVAHEMMNPLNMVRNFSSLNEELLNEMISAIRNYGKNPTTDTRIQMEDVAENVLVNSQLIAQHSHRIEQIVENLRSFSEEDDHHQKSGNPDYLLQQAVNLVLVRELRGSPIRVELILLESPVELQLGTRTMFRAIANILINAKEAVQARQMNEGKGFEGKIIIESQTDAKNYFIHIHDNGIGINESNMSLIFDPFFTTKLLEENHVGLGLYLSYEIIQKHNGMINVASRNNKTRVTIRLPLPDRGRKLTIAE